jgi:hypothetical protein
VKLQEVVATKPITRGEKVATFEKSKLHNKEKEKKLQKF